MGKRDDLITLGLWIGACVFTLCCSCTAVFNKIQTERAAKDAARKRLTTPLTMTSVDVYMVPGPHMLVTQYLYGQAASTRT